MALISSEGQGLNFGNENENLSKYSKEFRYCEPWKGGEDDDDIKPLFAGEPEVRLKDCVSLHVPLSHKPC
jgi:hypothetical protein